MKINTTDGYYYNEETNEWFKDGNAIDKDKIVMSRVYTKKGSATTSYSVCEMNELIEIGSITKTVDEQVADLLCKPKFLMSYLNDIQFNACSGMCRQTPFVKALSKLLGIGVKKKDYKQPDGTLAFRYFIDGELDNKKDIVAYVKDALKHPNAKLS